MTDSAAAPSSSSSRASLVMGAGAAFAAGACALANLATMLVAVRFDTARLHDFAGLHDVDAAAARWLVASMVTDAVFYLCLAPVALGLAETGVERGAWLQRAAGVAYALVGAGGALALVGAWPDLFARAAAGDAAAVARFVDVTTVVYRGVWNGACAALGAAWWVAVAFAARHAWRPFALLSLVLGVVSGVEALAVVVGLTRIADVVLDPYLALLPVWAIVAGAVQVRAVRAEQAGRAMLTQ